PPQSEIRFDLRREGSMAHLLVSNDGPPLPPDMQDKLFQSMVSVRDKPAPAETHLGLGLYIVRLITEFHGGRASARNRDNGKGVQIVVEFPLTGGAIA